MPDPIATVSVGPSAVTLPANRRPGETYIVAPSLPFTVVDLPYGPAGALWPTKRYDHGHGDLLTEEEVAVVAYVRHLEAENARLTAENTELTLRLFDLTPAAPEGPAEVPAKPQKAKK